MYLSNLILDSEYLYNIYVSFSHKSFFDNPN